MNKLPVDPLDELSDEDRAELLELANKPDEKDTVSHEEYLKATARWRSDDNSEPKVIAS